MQFKQYTKIKRLGCDETDGILDGECHIQEKIDGANTSIWLGNDGSINMGSRTQNVTDGSFRGFVEYVKNHEGINKILTNHPQLRLYGEWLVPHTVQYNETSYQHFYLFDIEDIDGKKYKTDIVNNFADEYNIKRPHYFGVFQSPTGDQLKEMCGKSFIGEKGEGIVIKNYNFVNKFGDIQYAKLVTEKFKEDNGIVFGGNNKHSESYWEMYCVNKYMTLERVKKIMNKLQSIIDHPLSIEDTARVLNTAYHDFITEEIWAIQKKVTGDFNFKKLAGLSHKKASRIYHDILNNFNSVSYEQENNSN